jgi:hypothetical protein
MLELLATELELFEASLSQPGAGGADEAEGEGETVVNGDVGTRDDGRGKKWVSYTGLGRLLLKALMIIDRQRSGEGQEGEDGGPEEPATTSGVAAQTGEGGGEGGGDVGEVILRVGQRCVQAAVAQLQVAEMNGVDVHATRYVQIMICNGLLLYTVGVSSKRQVES